MGRVRLLPKPGSNAFLRALLTALALGLSPQLALASDHGGDWRFWAAIGFGGTGINKNVAVDASGTPDPSGKTPEEGAETSLVERSEGPGTFALGVEYLFSDHMSVSLEHARGYRIGPYSSGVSFSGLSLRWYFKEAAPTNGVTDPHASTILIKRFTPFAGLGMGIASGQIARDNDLVANLNGSGMYVGARLGADFPLAPEVIVRPELVSSNSITGPAHMVEFTFRVALVLF